MDEVQTLTTGKAVWRAYRQAFEDFSQKVRQVQDLTAHPDPDRGALDVALIEVEKARAAYRGRRDVLASHLLKCSDRPQDIICRTTAA